MIPVDLYDHQRAMNDQCKAIMRTGVKSVLMQGVTGVGKSRMAAAQIQAAQIKGKKSVFVVPTRDLVSQMSQQFDKFEIEHSFVCAKHPFDPESLTHIATNQTLVNRLDCINPDVVFIDECHWGLSAIDKIINHYKSCGSYNVGLSATPMKMSGKGLGCWYDKMVEGPSIKWLIKNKYLSDYRLFAPYTPDLSGVPKTAGDFSKNKLAEFMESNSAVLKNSIKHYKQLAFGKIAVTFCSSIKHSEITNQQFNEAGIPSACVDGNTKDDERKRIFVALAKREILNICSVNLITTGFDLSSAAGMDVTVECIIDMRPTESTALQLQKNGRALRAKDYPAIIIDCAGNTFRHGLPDDDREWSLEDQTKSTRAATAAAISIRQCEKCDFVHKPAPICPNCGFKYPDGGRSIKEIEGELAEIKEREIKKAKLDKKKRRAACKTIDELIEFGIQEGYDHPRQWAERFMKIRNGYKKRW